MIYLLLGVIILIIISVAIAPRKVKYHYNAKAYIMTRAEVDLYNKLRTICKDRYYIFPQIHLSSLLDHRVKNQNFRAAFYHINGKSVDFVLVDQKTMKTKYIIELDDYTHNRRDRKSRDMEVDRIFGEVGIPLVRLSNTLRKSPIQIQNDIKNSIDKKK